MTLRTVFDGDHLRASLATAPDGPTGKLMVTFDFRQVGKSDFVPANVSASFAKAGFAQLSIKTRANDWFINPDTPALDSALADLATGFDEVRCLGYSMGGYGAFRFAGALRARSVVAVSPQVSIHPDEVPFDRRYRAESRGFGLIEGSLSKRGIDDLEGLVLYDPFVRADRTHATRLAALFPSKCFARLGFGGHPATRVLRASGKAWTVQKAALDPQSGRTTVLQAHRQGRRTTQAYWHKLADHVMSNRPDLGQIAVARAAAFKAATADHKGDGSKR